MASINLFQQLMKGEGGGGAEIRNFPSLQFLSSGLRFIFNLFPSMNQLLLWSRGLIGCVCQFRVNCDGGTQAVTVSGRVFEMRVPARRVLVTSGMADG